MRWPRHATTSRPIVQVQVVRISAVRRPSAEGLATNPDAHPVRVTDEEIVDALWESCADLEAQILAVEHRFRVESVQLEEIQPCGGSVLVRLRFGVDPDIGVRDWAAGLAALLIRAVDDVLSASLGVPVAVSASAQVAGPTASRSSASERLAPMLAVLGTGVGVAGFVTFVGGTIVWARVNAAGLPPAPTLGVFPSQDLLVIGAETLVPMIAQGIIVVAVLAALYGGLRWFSQRRGNRWIAHEAAVLRGQATLVGALGMLAFVFAVLAFQLCIAYAKDDVTFEQLLFAVLGILIEAAVAAAVGSRTRRFLYLATTTFALAGIFLVVLAHWREGNREEVRGAAVIRDHKKAVTGLFVAEGAGRVYLARIALQEDGTIDTRQSSLIGIAKTEVTDLAISDRTTPARALDRARQLAKDLCEQQLKPTPAGGDDCLTAPAGEPQP